MKASSNAHLRRKLLCALFAGSIAAPFAVPHAYALPIEGANAPTNAGEANISTSGTVMDIAGKTEHNVLRWEDFSVDSGEKVRFDNGTQTKDYLNLVTGEGASNIYGTIEGGRNVYLVNPHGILFAKDSQVNTGALYLSTANPNDLTAATNTFKANGTSPLSATAQTGDVLNLGTVKASKLYIEGKNVKVLNTDDIQNTDGTALTGTNVKIRSAETPHIGYDVGNRMGANFDESGGSVWHTFYDYANPNTAKSASGRGWDVANLGGAAHTDYDYMRVHTVYDLQNINAKRDGRYILAGDIDATATTHWNGGEGFAPLGSYNKFTGRFDGAGHTLRGLHINRHNLLSTGLFGYTVGAHIENLSLVDGDVKGNFEVGGIVGRADGTVIRNVSYAGRVDGMRDVGGIVGYALGSSEIQNVCNTGAITGNEKVGGIVGYAGDAAMIQNVCNTGAITGNEKVGGIAGYTWSTTLQQAWNAGTVTGSQQVGGIVGQADGGTVRHAVSKTGSAVQAVGSSISGADVTTDVKVAPEADMKLAATYTDWKDGSGNAIVATEGGKGTPWRIYNGHSMPLLTALMKGTKRLEKVYDGNVFTTTDPHITLVHTGKDVGTYDAYSDQFGYDLIGGAIIKPRALTIGAVAAQSKTYDGTTSADAAQFHATLNNVVSGEESLVTATATGAAYNSKDVRAANAVNYTGVALGGTGAGNYTLAASTAQGTGSITAKQLNLALTGGARFDKTYDGNANVTQTLTKGTNYSLTGFIGTEGDHLALASATGTYAAGKDAAVNKGVTFDGLTLTGTGAANYVLDKTTLTGTGTISPKTLNLALTGGARFDKTYDGNANVTQMLTKDGNYTLTNFVSGEGADIALAPVTGTYTDKNAGTGKAVTFGGLTLTGAGAGNYSLSTTTLATTGDIAKRGLTLEGTAGTQFTKIYDGNATVTQNLVRGANYRLAGVVEGEGTNIVALNESAAQGTYTTANAQAAGAQQNVTFTNLALTGSGAANYTLAANKTFENAGRITPKELNLALANGARFDKTYDGTANVTQSLTKDGNYSLTGFITGEGADIELDTVTGTYADKNAAADKAVTFGGLRLTGTGAGNYVLNKTALTGIGTISPKQLNLALTSGARFDKTYDGNANVTQSLTKGTNYTLTNFADGEGAGITITGAGTYTDKNAGTGKTVTFGGLTLTGAGAGNYSLSTTTLATTGDIAKRALTLEGTAGTQFTKTYDGNATVTQNLARGTNYRLAGVVEGEGTDIVALNESAAQGAYATANAQAAGAQQNVIFTNLALTGSGAGNYTLAANKTFENAGRITPKELNLALANGARFDKTYDGTANVTQSLTKGTNYTLAGFITGEGTDIELDTVTGTYADKNAAADKAVTFGGLTLTGTGAANYVLNRTSLVGTGTITKRALTLGAVAAQTKTYDGTTAADAAQFSATLGNVVAGDSVAATATGATYNDKNVAAAATVDYTGLALGGSDAGNYSVVSTAQGAGAITPRELTLTADAKTATQGEALPSFTGRADGFAAGEDASVFGAQGITFGSAVTNTNTPGSYAVTGRAVGVADGVVGNYRITQAPGNARAFTVNVMPVTGGVLASLIQESKPIFDDGYSRLVYLYGMPRPIPAEILGFYRFAPTRDLLIEGLRLD